ncbi:hypothetical protein BH11MYX4_BH11MYX4_00760 [soil metagenome]
MAFNRKFKTEKWFMRLPSGEIEITEASALERAFRCGLVDSRTPVLAVGGHLWTTLAEAADLEAAPMSVMPDVPEEPAADLANGAQWHVRSVEDEDRFRSANKRSRRAVLGIAVVAALAATLGVAWADGNDPMTTSMRSEAQALRAPDPALARAIRNVRAMEEVPHHSQRDLERLSKEQQRRLRELDLARRMRGDDKRDARRIAAGRPIVVPYENVSADPFGKGVSPFDPLNGAL